MNMETATTGSERIRDIVVSLGMEISDSIIASLEDAIADCRREDLEQAAQIEPIFMGLEAVSRHVAALRINSDPAAFGLLHSLLDTYDLVRNETEKQGRKASFEALQQVLDWQHNYMVENQGKKFAVQAIVPSEEEIVLPERGGLDARVIMAAIEQEIEKTGKMALEEAEALQECVQENSFSFRFSDNIDDLQLTFQEELRKLRSDLGLASSAI